MSITPLRRQYLRVKQHYPQAIVFFRLGDFYETFDQDAHITARELEITLTSRELGKGREDGVIGLKEYMKVKNNVLSLSTKVDAFYNF